MTPDETGSGDVGHLGTVTNSLTQLPKPILSSLRDNGVRWVVTHDSADQGFPDANLTAPQNHPPGWPAGRDVGDLSSMYVRPSDQSGLRPNTVVIGTENPNGDYSANVTLHETGHAYDDTNEGLSKSDEFRRAYLSDAPNMTAPDEATETNPSDAYYLAGSPNDLDRAAREAFAEGFARFYGSDDTLQNDWPAMYRFWQNHNASLQNAARFGK